MSRQEHPILLTANGLQVTIGHQVILNDVDVHIHENTATGLIGRNGTGKSTLLRILAQVALPDEGQVVPRGDLTIGFLPQEFALDDALSVRENIRAGARTIVAWLAEYESSKTSASRHAELEHRLNAVSGWDLDVRVEAMADALKVPPLDEGVSHLSGGERRRVALCRALVAQPDLLILDEPTNHLDIAAIEWLEAYLQRYRGSLLLVTHDRYFLDRVCSSILELADGSLYEHQGNYTNFLRRKAEREAELAEHERKRQSFLRREIDWVRRGPKARTTKSQARLQRFYDAANQAAPTIEGEVDLVIPPAGHMSQKIVILDDVSMGFGNTTLFSNLSFNFERGMIIGIVGPNGAGKTTLMKLILGESEPNVGTIFRGDTTRFNYIDQNRMQLDNDKTVFEDVGEGKDYVMLNEHKLSLWSYLRRFLFQDERIRTNVGQLSGGERNRAMLAKVIKYGGNFLLLDEPTNDLDLETLRVLEEGLDAFDGCVMVVSHDRYFLNRVCTGILGFDGKGTVVYQEGDYDYFLEKHPEMRLTAADLKGPASQAKVPSSAPAPSQSNKAKRKKLTWKEERELEAIEEQVMALDGEIEELQSTLASPDFYATRAAEAPALTQQLQALQQQSEKLYTRWEELEEKKAALAADS